MRPLCLVLAAPLFAGCFATSGASPNALPLVRAHAESDLDCPADEIEIVQKFGGRFEAFGCGHKTAYETACEVLQCVVDQEGHAIPWRSRPDPAVPP